jgi:peroxiredoxin
MPAKRLTAIAVVVAVIGAALSHVYAPAGVVVSFVGFFMTFHALTLLNVPVVRMGMGLCGLLNAYAAWRATGSWLIAAAVLPFPLIAVPRESIVTWWGFRIAYVVPATAVMSIALLVASGSPSLAWLAAAPMIGWAVLFSFMITTTTLRITRLGRPSWPIAVGKPMPDIILPTRNGGPEFQLSKERGRYVLLQLVRGDWCPVCHVIMRLLQRESPRLAAKNVKVVVITPSTGSEADDFAKSLGVDYAIAVDTENKLARELGACDEKAVTAGNGPKKPLPLPATFLVDPEGNLRLASRSDDVTKYTTPDDILRAIA